MKYLDLDLKQRKFLDWLVLGGREFIAVGDEVSVNKGEYTIHESKKQFFVKDCLDGVISDIGNNHYVVSCNGRNLVVYPANLKLVKQSVENGRLEDAIRKETEVLRLLGHK